VEYAKAGINGTNLVEKRVLMADQELIAFDLWIVHYAFLSGGPLATDEIVGMCVSTRREDQLDDSAQTVSFEDMVTERGLHFPTAWQADLVTEGGISFWGSNTIELPKAFRVPWLSWVNNSGLAGAANFGVTVYYDSVKVSALEKAELVNAIGGMARTE